MALSSSKTLKASYLHSHQPLLCKDNLSTTFDNPRSWLQLEDLTKEDPDLHMPFQTVFQEFPFTLWVF